MIPAPRYLPDVIRAIMYQIPSQPDHSVLIGGLNRAWNNSRYTAPEAMGDLWCTLAVFLYESLGKPDTKWNPDAKWKETIFEIFAARLDYRDFLPK